MASNFIRNESEMSAVINIPEEYILAGETFIDIQANRAYNTALDVIPFRSGNLASSFEYTIDMNNATIKIGCYGVESALYLDEDIPKTLNWWSKCVDTFETSFLGNYKEAESLAHSTEEIYGPTYNWNRVFSMLERIDKKIKK